MEKVPCQCCDTEILRATAEATGGYCMVCAQEWAPKVVEDMERRRKPYNFKMTPGEWIKGAFLLLSAGVMFMIVTTIVNIVLGVLAVLIAVYIFGVSWPNAIMFVTIAYLVIRFIFATLEVLDFKPKRRIKRSAAETEKATADGMNLNKPAAADSVTASRAGKSGSRRAD